jgi:hypothetical protein
MRRPARAQRRADHGPVVAPGDIPAGWTAGSWRARLRYLAAACEAMHPDKAAGYRAWADRIDAGDGRHAAPLAAANVQGGRP